MPERVPAPSSSLAFEARVLGRPDFDPELYTEACLALATQESACITIKEELELRHNWYRDAFFPAGTVSELELATLIPPYPLHSRTNLLNLDPRLARKVGGSTDAADKNGLTDVRLYADRVFASIKSGMVAELPPSFCDVLGTGQLDCCQALAGVTKNGSLFLAHIPGPGPWAANQFLANLEKTTPFNHLCFLYPEVPVDGYIGPRDAEQAHAANESFQRIAQAYSLPSLPFVSSSTPGPRHPSLSGLRTLVTIEASGICVSVNQEQLKRKPHGSYTEHYVPRTTRSITWE